MKKTISMRNWEIGGGDARDVLKALMMFYSPRGLNSYEIYNSLDAELTITWYNKEIGGTRNSDDALELAGDLWDHLALSGSLNLDVTDEETDDGFLTEMIIEWADDTLEYSLWVRWDE